MMLVPNGVLFALSNMCTCDKDDWQYSREFVITTWAGVLPAVVIEVPPQGASWEANTDESGTGDTGEFM